MSKKDDIRESVSQAYADAVNRPSQTPGLCCEPVQKGVVVKSAGYGKEELADLPADAVENSFGCGNPLAFSEVKTGEVVVDLGSGAGIDVLIASKKVGDSGRVIGIDMTDDMLARARANIEKAGVTNAEVRKGYIEALPIDDASVDWVISNCVINLSPDKPKVFAEIARVLKPGGKMLVSDIVAQDLPEDVLADQRLYCSCVSGAISEADYVQGLRDAGMDPVEVRERIVYDECQLAAFIESEIPASSGGGSDESPCCSSSCSCGPDDSATSSTGPSSADLAKTMQGKIWSAKVFAQKPA